ncbi:hypothetical protein [Microbacterium dauci]|uniref:Lipoprotein n=1 Tax=Microbacterium dauci TaxID=3048008 RepID=A0ABT6ZEY9_9MICO|nr:hypothetical protein [Microbacterium sp. LX3-4]MDJ1114726.1 hypothetical protein [Microbacterium sp. LX3-4]
MRRALGVVASVIVVFALAGCSGSLFGTGVSCAGWVSYESDEDRAADADAVVVVTDIREDGTVDILGYAANAYLVSVTESEKGPFAVGEEIRVGSTADNCSNPPYGDGDDMLDGETLRLYLTDAEDSPEWRTITPFDGVQVVD